jgi:predicted ATP-dependent endonuclease of OLD family|tara:strand:- start:679 stop:2715 length:2037 start_codon:yes stop_codon:yes gene_type:complete
VLPVFLSGEIMIVGLFLKHIKAYKGINFVPIGLKYKFISYVGENGVGKSSILESLDSFFNGRAYPINKSAISDSISTVGNEPFISPIFLIEKTKVTRQKKEFEKVSSFFWNVEKTDLHSGVRTSMAEFFDVRDELESDYLYTSDTHYLMVAGETGLSASSPKLYFGSFHDQKVFIHHMTDEENRLPDPDEPVSDKAKLARSKDRLVKLLASADWKRFFTEIKSIYSYVYFPVELEVESFTKIETVEMQKIFDKKLKLEIENSLKEVNLDKVGGINKSLERFVTQIEGILNNEYCYHTGQDRNNKVTKTDLVNKILEVYFQKRILNKSGEQLTKVSELSAGEKRQALINLVYAFLKRDSERENFVIIGIDEPENSLHTSLCYDQFEKLKDISDKNQVLITTHWYGFLPVISEGYAHFLKVDDKKIGFESYDLYDYKAVVKSQMSVSRNQIPTNFSLKSTNDLIQSIYYSLMKDIPYNWIICEGVSEKIYFEYFFADEIKSKNLRILPMGGQSQVIRLFRYLQNPISETEVKGRVYCLVDTDVQRCQNTSGSSGSSSLMIRRLSNKSNNIKTHLLALDNPDTCATDIEQALDPRVFATTMKILNGTENLWDKQAKNENGNSDFIHNFKDLDLADFFKANNGNNKVVFARKYIEVSANYTEDFEGIDVVPDWIKEIKKYIA